MAYEEEGVGRRVVLGFRGSAPRSAQHGYDDRVAVNVYSCTHQMEKQAIEDCVRQGHAAVRLPTPEETVEHALRFEDVLLKDPARGREELRLLKDPARGREELRRLFDEGRVMLRPQPQGFYLAQGKLLPLALFSLRLDERDERSLAPEGARPAPHRSHRELEFSCSSHGCAGAIRPLEHGIFKEFVVA
jgi:hypothetical protein